MSAKTAMVELFNKHRDTFVDLFDLEGDCAIWKGPFDEDGNPCYVIGKMRFSIRTIFFVLATGQFRTSMLFHTQCHPDCVNPKHFYTESGTPVIEPTKPKVVGPVQTTIQLAAQLPSGKLADRVRGASGTERIKVYA